MGVRLIVEVLDHWKDVGLTAGERDDLIVIAENANDRSRETWGAIHEPFMLKRANKTPASWRIAINRLMKKKALEFALREGKEQRGRTGRHAVYRLPVLCPDPPHDGYKGFCTRPDKDAEVPDAADAEGYLTANPVSEDQEEGYLTANPQGYPSANAVEGVGYLTATECVSSQLTPTPPSFPSSKDPSDTPSSSLAEVEPEVLEGELIEEGGGGGGSDDSSTKLATEFVAALDYRGKQPRPKTRVQLVERVTAAFAAGWTVETLATQLDLGTAAIDYPPGVYLHRLEASELGEPPAGPAAGPSYPPPCEQCFENYREGAVSNMRLRMRDGQACPDCHPSVVGMVVQDSGDGDRWGHVQQRVASGDWSGTGTDDRVAGWLSLSNSLRDDEREHVPAAWLPKPSTTDQRVHQALEVGRRLQAEHDAKTRTGGHKPYSNDIWERMKQQAADGVRPSGADGQPHCGTCDEYTRTREVEGPSGPHFEPCSRCHPALSF